MTDTTDMIDPTDMTDTTYMTDTTDITDTTVMTDTVKHEILATLNFRDLTKNTQIQIFNCYLLG